MKNVECAFVETVRERKLILIQIEIPRDVGKE